MRSIEEHIKSVPGLDIEEIEKGSMKLRLEKKLLSLRHSSAAQVESMIEIVTAAETDKKKSYLDVMTNLLARIRVPISKN